MRTGGEGAVILFELRGDEPASDTSQLFPSADLTENTKILNLRLPTSMESTDVQAVYKYCGRGFLLGGIRILPTHILFRLIWVMLFLV